MNFFAMIFSLALMQAPAPTAHFPATDSRGCTHYCWPI